MLVDGTTYSISYNQCFGSGSPWIHTIGVLPDPHGHWRDEDPDPGGEKLGNKTENCRNIEK